MARRTRLGVLGWPVAHSRSPAMHNAALQAVGLADWRYQLLPVPPELFDETVKALPRAGFRGANVTIPYKEAALALATDPTPRAHAIGAANTLTFGDAGQIHADNTDAPALVEALPFAAAGNTALVLGAGGSARAVVWALLDADAGEVRVWNRRPERARRLCAELGCAAIDRAAPADLLVNCSPIGLQAPEETFKALPLTADRLDRYRCVVDLAYADGETPLVQAARARGIPVVDGLALLVGQGALSFEAFTGRTAPIDAMRAAVHRP
jgi:shikimate dehydrogenase